MLLRLFSILAATAPFAFADVAFDLPSPGTTVAAGPITVEWHESKTAPLISDLSPYNLQLMIGGAKTDNIIAVATNPNPITGLFNPSQSTFRVSLQISPSAGPPDKNAYFFQITSSPLATKGSGSVVNYSKRFTISGMTGKWPAGSYQSVFKALGGTSPAVPPTSNGVTDAVAGDANPAAGVFGTSYQFQTGPTKYAPMQVQPGKTITKTDMEQHYPTSAWTIATTFLKIFPTIETTVTQNPTDAAVISRENTASPAPMPSDDMQKFLARWKDD